MNFCPASPAEGRQWSGSVSAPPPQEEGKTEKFVFLIEKIFGAGD